MVVEGVGVWLFKVAVWVQVWWWFRLLCCWSGFVGLLLLCSCKLIWLVWFMFGLFRAIWFLFTACWFVCIVNSVGMLRLFYCWSCDFVWFTVVSFVVCLVYRWFVWVYFFG